MVAVRPERVARRARRAREERCSAHQTLRNRGASGETGLERTSGTALREENAAVNYVWSAVVTFANGLAQLRTIARHTRHGRIVVYDRYALDSTVQLRFRYGSRWPVRVAAALIDVLAPKPVAAFYLDIPPEISLARKDDRWTLGDLTAQARLYREESRGLARRGSTGCVRPTSSPPRSAKAVWRALG